MSVTVTPRKKRPRNGILEWASADLFRVLADPNRIELVKQLLQSGTTRTVSELAPCCPVDMSVVSRHLRQLREAGILEARREGKSVFYRVRVQEMAALLRRFADALEHCCGGKCEPAPKKARGKAPARH